MESIFILFYILLLLFNKKQVDDWHYLSRQCQVLRGTSRARVELATSPEEHDAADLER